MVLPLPPENNPTPLLLAIVEFRTMTLIDPPITLVKIPSALFTLALSLIVTFMVCAELPIPTPSAPLFSIMT